MRPTTAPSKCGNIFQKFEQWVSKEYRWREFNAFLLDNQRRNRKPKTNRRIGIHFGSASKQVLANRAMKNMRRKL